MADYCKYSNEELINFYREDHNHPTKVVMWGQAIHKQRHKVKPFILSIKPESILDYGSGKGFQYSQHRIHEEWMDANDEYNAPYPHCYDPGVEKYSEKPNKKFDVVLCFDVMEHIKVEDCDSVLQEIFDYAEQGVCFNIATNPARKSFPDGTNYHVNCKPEEWWFATIKRLKPPHLRVWLYFWTFNGVIKLHNDTNFKEKRYL